HARIAPANVEGTDTLWPIDLVTGKRKHIDVIGHHVDRHLTNSLHGVCVEYHALLMTDLPDLANRLQNADFVVCCHDAYEDGLVVHGALQVFEIDKPISLHRQICNTVPILLKTL